MSRDVHFLLTAGNRLWGISLPLKLVRFGLVLSVAVALAVGSVAVDGVRRTANQKRLSALALENRILHDKMAVFAAGVESLKTELSRLREFDAQVRLSANMPLIHQDIRAMGIGGGNTSNHEPGAELENSIEWLLEQAKFQRNSFADITTNLEKQLQLQTSTPSIMPTSGWISSTFGFRRDPLTGRNTQHEGLDIVGVPGQPIIATGSGTVVVAGPLLNWGRVVEIDHGRGIHTFYAHCQSISVKVGDRIRRGQQIATLGNTGRSTGFHCHYGVKLNGNWTDPMKYILSD